MSAELTSEVLADLESQVELAVCDDCKEEFEARTMLKLSRLHFNFIRPFWVCQFCVDARVSGGGK